MNTHKTKGIVLRTVKYGDTSVIASVYTELFGLQSYMVKGVRQSSRKSSGKAQYFQPGAILDMVVYHYELKQIQFIKEFNWGYLYREVLHDVVKNAVCLYIVEMLQHCLKQPEANPELFHLAEDSLKQLDRHNETFAANLPLFFTLHLAAELGFGLQGSYSKETPVLDLKEGFFVRELPDHPWYLSGDAAAVTGRIAAIPFYNELSSIPLNRLLRRELLHSYQQFMALHIEQFAELKSLKVLQEVLD